MTGYHRRQESTVAVQIAIAGEHFQLMRELLPSEVWID